MMKKRNMALAMAAVSVAASVAPAFAAEKDYDVVVDEYASFESQIKKMLATEYTGDKLLLHDGTKAGQKVFAIDVTTKSTTDITHIRSLEDLEKVSKWVKDSKRGDSFAFAINDAGHVVNKDSKVVDQGTHKYTMSEINELKAKLGETKDGSVLSKGSIVGKDYDVEKYAGTYEYNENTGALTLTYKGTETGKTLGHTKTVELTSGMEALDIKNPEVDSTSGKITKFNAISDVLKPESYTVTVSNSKVEKLSVNDNNVDKTGEELVSKYVIKPAEAKDIKEVNGKFETTLLATDIKLNSTRSANAASLSDTLVQIKVDSEKKSTLEKLIKIVNEGTGFKTIIGEDRIDTAIKLSKEKFPTALENPAVVLVGQNAIVDGLAASPLAAEKKAPILLTESGKLTESVKTEMKRVLNVQNTVSQNKDKTVYIVGGTAVISASAEKELSDMGLNVKRLSGDDRYATSLKIADEISNKRKAYVVDGYALADAMSISPVAAKTKQPIVVVDGKNGLNKDNKDFLAKASSADIIGGTAAVKEDTLKAVEKAVGLAERVSGNDRQETNAKVINKYFKTDKTGEFYVAKDGYNKEDFLVDALAAGPYAQPIVLATNALSTEQAIAINDSKQTGTDLTQVGGGIADSVIKQIKSVLGL